MSYYDLYGINKLGMKEARQAVEECLGVSLSENDSDYQGGVYYTYGDLSGEHLILKLNKDPFEEEPAEDEFPQHSIVLYVNDTSRSYDIEAALSQSDDIKHLRREHL
jgi:hypothetical protein